MTAVSESRVTRRGSPFSASAVLRSMTVVGTKPAMPIMREAHYGTTRFDDFARRVGITKAAASARLTELVELGSARLGPVSARARTRTSDTACLCAHMRARRDVRSGSSPVAGGAHDQRPRTSIRQVGPCARASRASSVKSVASNASASAT